MIIFLEACNVTVSFKALIMKMEYTSDFFVGMSSMNYQMLIWAKNQIAYVQIFEKIEFSNFPCYFPFKIFGRFRIFRFYLYDLTSIGSTKIFKIWFPKWNFTLNLMQVSEKFIKFTNGKNMHDFTKYYWFFIQGFRVFLLSFGHTDVCWFEKNI